MHKNLTKIIYSEANKKSSLKLTEFYLITLAFVHDCSLRQALRNILKYKENSVAPDKASSNSRKFGQLKCIFLVRF